MKVAFLTTDSREHFKDYENPQPYFGKAPEALLEGFKSIPEDIEVHVVSCLQREPISSPAKLADNIYYHALHVPNIGWLKTGYQGCIRAVRWKLREIQPNIVHGQGTERDCALCAVLSGFPNVLTIHGVMRAIFQLTNGRALNYHWFAKHLETFALRNTSGVIAISPYVDELVSPFTPCTWFIPNALQLFFFTPAPSPSRRRGPPRLVNVGVISRRKRQLELLERLLFLRSTLSFEMTFVGKAGNDTYAKRFKETLQTAENRYGGFNHIEYLPNDAFRELYDDSDAMIHFSSEESFGLTFAEALSRSLPLFASDVGAIRQISEGVTNCSIFNPDDLNGLIFSIGDWIKSEKYLRERGQIPDSSIKARYHPTAIAKQHLAIYRSVAALL